MAGGTRAMAGIVQGIQKSQDRYTKIQAARHKKKQDDELFDLKKKKFNLEIEEKQKLGEWDDFFVSQLKESFKEQEDLFKAKSKIGDRQLNDAEKQETERLSTLKRTGAKVMSSLQGQQDDLPFDYSYTPGTGFKFKSKKSTERKVTPVDKALGEIGAGEQATALGVRKLKTREEAERHATRKLGSNWQTRFPEAVDMLDKQWGYDYPLDTTEAVEWLQNEKGMSKSQAIQTIRLQEAKKKQRKK